MFHGLQDTVIGLQALSEYTIKTFSSNVKLEITLAAPGWTGRSQQLNNENRYLLETIKDVSIRHSRSKELYFIKGYINLSGHLNGHKSSFIVP